jgi:plasmid rolling circle replication initiator protein Rep
MPDEFFLSDVSERDKPWDAHRAESELVQSLYEGSDYGRYAERMQQCSRFLGFNWAFSDSTGDLSLKLQDARFCRVRHCPVCQWRKSLMWRARFYKAVPKILESYPNHQFIFLTLTIQNCQVNELGAAIAQLNSSWKKLTKRKQFPAIGWLKAVEVTRNDKADSKWFNTAHPHLHVLLMVPNRYFNGSNYISQSKWRELWQSCLRVDYLPVVNVKSVKPKSNEMYSDALRLALTETLKYSVKPADLTANRDWLIQLTHQLKGSRSVAVGGVLRDFIREDEPEDLIHPEDSDELSKAESEIWFGWRQQFKRYQSLKIE